MFTLFALLFSNPVMAEDCDAKQLQKDIAEASPVSVPRIYLKLVDCDADAANDSAEDTLARVLHGDEGNQAALAALKVGAQRQVMEWVDNLEPDQRSQTMLWLGDQCSEVDTIGQFFVDSASEMREPFIKERWYRGMAKCRTAEVQGLLKDVVEQGAWDLNREQTFGFLEVYARNLGAGAIDHLKQAAMQYGDPKETRLVLNAFGDAANVGSVEGINEDAAKQAIAALYTLAPQIHFETMDQLRDTFLALGDVEKSNEVVRYRWPDALKDSTYHYGVVATETVTCKNGKEQVVFHQGELTDVGTWPDKLEMDVAEVVTAKWALQAAEKCKGTGSITVEMTPEPLTDDAAFDAWLEPHQKAYAKAAKNAWKSDEIDHGVMGF